MTRNDNGKAKAGETEALLEKEKGMTNKTTTSKKEKSKETPKEGSKHDDGSKFEYEFGGPVGALATTLSLPVVVLLLDYWSDIGGVNFKIADMREYFLPNHDGTSWLNCLLALIGWFVLQILLERLLPCELVQGMPVTVPANTKTETTTTTKRLTYRINGHLAFWITWLLFVMGVPYVDKASGYWQLFVNGPLPLYQFVVPNYSTLALLMILLCFVMSVYLYANSFRSRDVIVAKGGNSGNACYDFFIGRELNPRCLGGDATGLDIKEFCELRPGLIGWMVLNVAFAQQQHSEPCVGQPQRLGVERPGGVGGPGGVGECLPGPQRQVLQEGEAGCELHEGWADRRWRRRRGGDARQADRGEGGGRRPGHGELKAEL